MSGFVSFLDHDKMPFMLLDVSVVLIFIVYSVSVGFALRRAASRGMTDYFLAGRSLKGWQAGVSMAATQYAADTPLLVTGLVATAGIFSLWRLWVYAIAFLMMGFVLGACWRRAQVLTDAEFTELRYAGTGAAFLRAVKAVHMGTLINCTVLAMVLIAATRIAEPFLTWHMWLPESWVHEVAAFLEAVRFRLTALPPDDPMVWIRSADNFISILLIVAFTTLYSTTGGLRSVVATDVVQFSIAMIATAIYAWFVVDHIGGLRQMGDGLVSLYGDASRRALLAFGPPNWSDATLLFISVLAIQWFAQINADGTGYLAQRTMACVTDREAKKAAVIFTFAQVCVRSLLWLPIILGLLVIYPAGEVPGLGQASESFRVAREGTFAMGIRDLLPVGLRGLMLTGMLAALASTVDTHLNWGASYWTNDLYKRFVMQKLFQRDPHQRELVWIARLSNLGILVIAMTIMARLDSIQTAWHLSLLFGSGLGVVLILRWVWHRINVWSEITAGLSSFMLAPLLLYFFPDTDEGARLLWMVSGSTAAVMIVTLITPPESRETLVRFYDQVRPPGFWKKVAVWAEDKPGRSEKLLRRSLAATVLASLTVFGWVIGIGKLITGFGQGQNLWFAWGMIFAGSAVIPVWWRLGFHDDSIELAGSFSSDKMI